MKNNFGLLIINTCFLILLIFSVSACTPRHLDKRFNEQEFPIKEISELIKKDLKSFVRVKEAPVYISFKNYDYFIIDYTENSSFRSVSIAVSKDRSVFFFLNYPEKFSIDSVNKLTGLEGFTIKNEAQLILFMKFVSKLFIPETSLLDDVKDDLVSTRGYGEAARLKRTLDTYKTETDYKKGKNNYSAISLYSLNGGEIMYKWEAELYGNGRIGALKVTVISIDQHYIPKDQIVIMDEKRALVKPRKGVYDPTK